ncbi:MAG TPA: hypothetical protein V6D12_14005 [Candidatus Obscuribacterales bacterium]
MGDTGEAFEAYNEVKRKEREEKEPDRVKYALNELNKIHAQHIFKNDHIQIMLVDGIVEFWPFTGWYCGRRPLGNIKGRGIANLIRVIKEKL